MTEENIELEKLTFKELQAEAKARKILIGALKTKTKLIEAITKYETDAPEADPEEEEPTPEGEGGGELAEPEATPTEEAPVAPVKEVVKGAIDVFDTNGKFLRTFDEERHGKDYKEICARFVGPQSEFASKLNSGRTTKPHNETFVKADVVDATGRVRETFTREQHGVGYREMAMAYASAGLATLIGKQIEGRIVEEELHNKIISARVELR